MTKRCTRLHSIDRNCERIITIIWEINIIATEFQYGNRIRRSPTISPKIRTIHYMSQYHIILGYTVTY